MSAVGTQQASPPVPATEDVFPCCSHSAEENDCAICHSRWEPSAEQDLEAEPSTIELIYPDSTREEIAEIYHNMYQLQRSPGKMPCDEETEWHLWHKWVPTQPGEEPGQSPVSIPRANPQANCSTRNHATYDSLKDMMQL